MTVATARDPRHAIRTSSGRLFWPLDAREEEIQLEDIAHALSQLCRFVGHTRMFYSVAQHSVLVSRLCPPADALHGLLHDASEAYLGDVSRPIKHQPIFAAYREAETRLQGLVYLRFGLTPVEPKTVKAADEKALHAELRDFIKDSDPKHIELAAGIPGIVAQRASFARDMFLDRFHALVNGKNGK
jgi:hypothetical protein